MSNSKVLIAISTYREAENIENLISKIKNYSPYSNILIINDYSDDQTKEIINKISDSNLVYLERPKKLGLGTAHKLSIFYAIKFNYDFLLTMDADFSHDPNEIGKIIDYLDEYDFVIGSRYVNGGKNVQPLFRYLISYLGNKLIKFLLKSSFNEFTTSYRGFNLKKLNNFNLNQIKGNGYSFFMETVIVLERLKYKSFEFPIHFKDRIYGKSKYGTIDRLFKGIKDLIRVKKIINSYRNKYD